MVPSQSPKPILYPSPLHVPVMVMESPSLINFLSTSLEILIGLVPFQHSSSREPYSDSLGPLMVPDPSKSPGFMLQPVTVW
mmetsp:Transcript_0/g.2  ORF Transcript_0/g.2 Transcript_0/m.2 type:complete len:81 (-) Transcript_0:104-346(-)